jgi:proline iminopeptidase
MSQRQRATRDELMLFLLPTAYCILPTASQGRALLLHGGPGVTHEYLEAFDSYLPGAGIEYYYYDQLGSYYSDQPNEPELWELPRFVEEVEQVRQALGLDRSNFYLYGQSWGGLLAMEYALKYGQNLKGLVISNMMSSIPSTTPTRTTC